MRALIAKSGESVVCCTFREMEDPLRYCRSSHVPPRSCSRTLKDFHQVLCLVIGHFQSQSFGSGLKSLKIFAVRLCVTIKSLTVLRDAPQRENHTEMFRVFDRYSRDCSISNRNGTFAKVDVALKREWWCRDTAIVETKKKKKKKKKEKKIA